MYNTNKIIITNRNRSTIASLNHLIVRNVILYIIYIYVFKIILCMHFLLFHIICLLMFFFLKNDTKKSNKIQTIKMFIEKHYK